MIPNKSSKPLIEIRYLYQDKIMNTEWMYIHENGHKIIFKKFQKAQNYLINSLKLSSWDTDILNKSWKAPSVKPKNSKVTTKKAKTKGIKNADEYLRAKLKSTNPYKLEDVGSTVDFTKKPKKKNDWTKKFTG